MSEPISAVIYVSMIVFHALYTGGGGWSTRWCERREEWRQTLGLSRSTLVLAQCMAWPGLTGLAWLLSAAEHARLFVSFK